MQPEIPAVLVEAYILQARNLPRKNAAGQSDTFCLVEATGSPQKYRTNVVPGTLHPVWNESFQVKVRDPPSQMITVKIWAEKRDGNHDFVGVVVVPVSRIESGAQSTEEGWYEIRGERNDVLEGPDGMSKVELSFVHKKAAPNEQQVSGFMFKKADESEEWIRRFAILDPYSQLLQFFENPKSVMEGAAFLSEEVNTRTCKVDVLEISEIPASAQRTSYAFKLVTNFHNFLAQVNTLEERDTWVEALRHIGNPPGIRFLPAPPSREKRPEPSSATRDSPRTTQSPRVIEDPPVARTPPSKASSGDGDSKVANPLQDAANSGTHGAADSEGLWQKKFDATRRALADQVAQNQALQARVAELENGKNSAQDAARESSELRAALEKNEGALSREKQRTQQLQRELDEAKLAPKSGNSDSHAKIANEGLEAKIAALEGEKRQMQGEVEHLRRSLEKSQEKVALLQLQDNTVDLSRELKKQLEDAHRSLAEVKQKHLRSEQSRMAAEAEAQELRTALEDNSVPSSQQDQLMLGLKQQVDVLTKRLENMGQALPSVQSSVYARPRSRSPETVTPARPMVASVPTRGRNSKARELCADITSTLNSRRHTRPVDTRPTDYVPGTNLPSDRASLSPPPRAPANQSPRVPLVISPDDPNLM